MVQVSSEKAGFKLTNPHKFRHAGASMDEFLGVPQAQVQARGHWKHSSSMLRYHKPGRYARSLAALTKIQKERFEVLMAGGFMTRLRRVLRR